MADKSLIVNEKSLTLLIQEHVFGFRWFCYRSDKKYSPSVQELRWFMPPLTNLPHLRLCRKPDLKRRAITGMNGIPSRTIEGAWKVVEKMRERGYIFTIMSNAGEHNDLWLARFGEKGRYTGGYPFAKTEGISICLAALATLGIEVTYDSR